MIIAEITGSLPAAAGCLAAAIGVERPVNCAHPDGPPAFTPLGP